MFYGYPNKYMNQRVSKNVLVAVLQILVTGSVLFVLYRFLVIEVGVQQVGVWSLVYAVASVSGIAQLGIGGSVVRYVAKYLANSSRSDASNCIQTAVISSFVLMTIGASLLYPLLYRLLGVVVESHQIAVAQTLLLPALVAVILNAVSGVSQSALDGSQRIDIRGYIIMAGGLIYLACVYQLVPAYGVIGLVYAQIIQGLFLLIVTWIFLRLVLPNLPLIPHCWSRGKFGEMLGYGVNFQLISLTQVFNDPATKLLLGHFGGLSVIGYYEMANRMVMQLRALLVAGNQVLVPVVSVVSEGGGSGLSKLYLKSLGITLFVSTPFFFIIISISPFISRIWVGSYESVFVLSVVIISLSRWINTLSSPAYFSYLGTGYLRAIVVGHISVSFFNVLFGFTLGGFMGGLGPIVGSAIALSLGGVFIIASYHKMYGIRLIDVNLRYFIPILLACIVAAMLSLYLYRLDVSHGNMIYGLVAAIAVFVLLVFPVMWKHPLRAELSRIVFAK